MSKVVKRIRGENAAVCRAGGEELETTSTTVVASVNGDRSENPLLNQVVMTEFFKNNHFTVEELKNVRLVCSLWCKLSLKKWRDISTVRLGPFAKSQAVINESLSWPFNDFYRQCKDPSDAIKLRMCPFKNFKFNNIHIHNYTLLQITENSTPHQSDQKLKLNPRNFWNDIGPVIHSIHFEKCTFKTKVRNAFDRIIAEKLVNLRTLTLTRNIVPSSTSEIIKNLGHNYLYDFNLDEYRNKTTRNYSLKEIKIMGSIPVYLPLLLLNSPNIEVLQMGRPSKSKFWSYIQYACNLKIQLDGAPFPLKCFDVMGLANMLSRRNFWHQVKLPLEHLTLTLISVSRHGNYRSFKGEKDNTTILIPTINRYAEQLQVLKLFRPPIYRVLQRCPFRTVMSSMRELHLYGNIVHKLDFLNCMPNLQVLYVDFTCYGKLKEMKKSSNFTRKKPGDLYYVQRRYRPYRHGKVKLITENQAIFDLEKMDKLHLNLMVSTLSVQTVAGWMPNLRILEIIVDDAAFEMICLALPNLEELKMLFGSTITDDAIIGLDANDIQRPDNITALKKLKRFELQDLCEGRSTASIGDKSVYEGFLKMSALRYLKLYVGNSITEAAADALKLHVRETILIRLNGKHKSECCAVRRAMQTYGVKR